LWREQEQREREFFDEVRDRFNQTQRPEHFLYLLARCVKASVRYNSKGEFNQSPDNRRKGMRPETMRQHIRGASYLLQNKTQLSNCDYKDVVLHADPSDVIYMDPPYQGVSGNRNPRYRCGVSFGEFIEVLHALNIQNASYILSYDGRNDLRTYGEPLPTSLDLMHVEIKAGRSTQATLLGRNATTFESLYLSPALAKRLDARVLRPSIGGASLTGKAQLALFERRNAA
jgi:DNA adenine methylase